jgi:hypothetical protein
MKSQVKLAGVAFLLLCLVAAGATTTTAQQTRDPLRGLKRAITEANAPALSADQETQLNTLITAYRDALPDEPDAALEAARDAFDAAVLAGALTAAQAQATIIANRTAELTNTRLRAEAAFEIAALASLKTGGQYDPLVAKFGAERVLALVGSLVGRGPGGGPGRGPHR